MNAQDNELHIPTFSVLSNQNITNLLLEESLTLDASSSVDPLDIQEIPYTLRPLALDYVWTFALDESLPTPAGYAAESLSSSENMREELSSCSGKNLCNINPQGLGLLSNEWYSFKVIKL